MPASLTRIALYSFTSLSLMISASAAPAYAGFEFVPAKTQTAPAPKAAEPEIAQPLPSPVAPVSDEPLQPMAPIVNANEYDSKKGKLTPEPAPVQSTVQSSGSMKTLVIQNAPEMNKVQKTDLSSAKPMVQIQEEKPPIKPLSVPPDNRAPVPLNKNVSVSLENKRNAEPLDLVAQTPVSPAPQDRITQIKLEPTGDNVNQAQAKPVNLIEKKNEPPLKVLVPTPQVTQDKTKKIQDVQNTNPATSSAPVIKAEVAAAPQKKSKAEIIEGFGKDIPLALALRQVVPPQYAFSFAKGVNLGQRVSWNGDRPWDEALQDMLTSVKLQALRQNNIILIKQNTIQAPDKGKPNDLKNNKSIKLNPFPLEHILNKQEPAAGDSSAQKAEAELKIKRIIVSDPGETPSTQAAVNASLLDVEKKQAVKITDKPLQNVPKPLMEEKKSSGMTLDNQKEKPGLWNAQKGESLKAVLQKWSEKSGFQVIWEASHDYVLDADVNEKTNLKLALDYLFEKSLSNSKTDSELSSKSAKAEKDNVPFVRYIGQKENNPTKFSAIIIQDQDVISDMNDESKNQEPVAALKG